MRERFQDRTEFLTVYIKEAHTDDEWQMGVNEEEGICYVQPTSLAERAQIASAFVKDFSYQIPIVVDAMDNAVEEAYAGWPERLYVIDASGIIAYKGGVGPSGFDPDELESWLEEWHLEP